MQLGYIYAFVTALLFGLWTVFHDQATKYINSLFGAIVVSLVAVLVGLLFFIPQIKPAHLVSNPKGLIFAALAGVCALGIDYFALKTYGSGLEVSTAGPIIIGGSVAVASTIGFFLGDSVSVLKVMGLVFVIGGSVLLTIASK